MPLITVATNPLIEIRNGRLAKAASLRSAGLNPYPSRSKRTHYARTILDNFQRAMKAKRSRWPRLMSWRKQGALAFAHVQDQTGRLQLFLPPQPRSTHRSERWQVGIRRSVRENEAYLTILLLSRVVTRIGDVDQINPGVIESLFAPDLAFLQDLYRRINQEGHTHVGVTCPSCHSEFMVDVTSDLSGGS